MEAKEFLERVLRINEQMESKKEMISGLDSMARRQTPSYSFSGVKSGGTQRTMADAVDMVVDLQKEIEGDLKDMCGIYRDILCVIRKLGKPEHRLILEKRYITGKQFSEIAYDMNLSISRVYTLHEQALDAVDDMLCSAGGQKKVAESSNEESTEVETAEKA